MQVPTNEILTLIIWVSAVFLLAPLFLIVYVTVYNSRKKKHLEETERLRNAFRTELLQTQMEVQEQTLKTIGNDLHDNINQLLGLMTITLSAVDLSDTEKAAGKIAAAEELARRSIREIRALSRLMHGEELVGKGLANAIAFELDWLEKSGRYQIHRTGSLAGMPKHPETELFVFRIFQETLHNIIRHAQATSVFIEQSWSDNTLTLTLTDDGAGFDVEAALAKQSGMGLQNIRKRAAMIGGAAAIRSAPGKGSSVTITVPRTIQHHAT
ncbi:ATP-binding protein [Chitinophaga sp.]|uniref:sensor histidine kinase n=1 Tax=Chitinophaga sp. TaxID=1869181 RepID=UPI00262E5E8A|nr:ATP-binding protein [uncultured Chitinophaga sp.]